MSRVRRLLRFAPLALGALVAVPAGAGADPGTRAGAAGDQPYTVTVSKISAQKGQPATAKVVITPAKGWHINRDFPTSLKLRPPAGVTARKAELGKADAALSDHEGRFEVVLTSSEPGKKSVPGDLRFAVCSETSCAPQRSAVTIEMNVQ